ncbi:extracellular solute-binding protein [Leeia sp. TBRC 13508]|uniref:Putrescine-binding periplasmic protein n=1 Tax=Leeia speluncae TaxID=2884804 RepID=A0ABS8D6Y4_9NEIS|nr:extracellular solute-binding protein [Leeia speluncae]MCB6183936.1 extracellular solute-binding protein [Leeia speluncae]
MKLRLIAAMVLSGLSAVTQAAEMPELHIFAWADYFAPDALSRFTKETGIKIIYDKFESNEVLQAKLLTGRSGYDVVFPASEFVSKQIAAGLYLPIDKKKLTNYHNLDGNVMGKASDVDPGNRYGVPYVWGTVGVAIRPAAVKAALAGMPMPADPLALLFDARYTSKLKKCGISYLDAATDVGNMALAYQGKSLVGGKFDLTALDAAMKVIQPARADVRLFNSTPIDPVGGGDVCVAMMYSGDAYTAAKRAKEVGSKDTVTYLLPKQVIPAWMDMMAIPKDAPHPDNAHRFINYMMEAKVAAETTNFLSFVNPNGAATAFVRPEIRNDPKIYLPADTIRQLALSVSAPQAYQLKRQQFFYRFKSAK